MPKIRFIIFLITVLIVGTIATTASFYARGYRLDSQTLRFSPNGLLVIKSHPDGAQVFLNGEFKTATNATIPLPPGSYDVIIRKEGYKDWAKRLTITKEVVTESTAHLFRSAPSLSALTFFPSLNPLPSRDFTKLAYQIPPNLESNLNGEDRAGLWTIEMLNLPLGFAREPRRITDGDLTNTTWLWSPDGREILLTTNAGASYLLNATTFTPQSQLTNISATREAVLAKWQEDLEKKQLAQLRKLPDELEDILLRKAKAVVLSPDEDMVLYTASASATIPANLIPQLPGASTQAQTRDIKQGRTYIYDIKEDRNFLIDESDKDLVIEGGSFTEALRRLSWFPTSRHLILAEPNQIIIMDYDGTNRQVVYSGNYVAPHAYSSLSLDRIIILTNLGANSNPPNLYSLGLK